MTLTPASLRLDAPGRACGQSFIAAGKTCRQKGAFPTGKAIAAGLGVAALGVGAYALSRRGKGAATSSSGGSSPSSPPRLPGLTPRALLAPAPPRKSKTQRMRENTANAVRGAERAMGRAAQAEITRAGAVANAMASAGEATGMAAKTTLRELRLRTEAARRRFEPGYRAPDQRRLPGGIQAQLPQQGTAPQREAIPLDPRTGPPRRRRARGFGRTDNFIQHYAPVQLQPPTRRDTEDGKKYTKVVTNPETGRKNKVRYGAQGYKIAPGTDKGDRYCARSFGDMKSEGYDCSGAERNTPLCLSRAKWRCSGKASRRDGALTPGKSPA